MYENDKVQRITLRLTQKQFDFVKLNADYLGVSPSEFLRMVVNSAMFTIDNTKISPLSSNSAVITIGQNESEVEGRENDETNKHNLI